jgi:hypothetical protein
LNGESNFLLDIELKEKTEKLLGIKGYCTNIPENEVANEELRGISCQWIS